jgi:hypothetical protein
MTAALEELYTGDNIPLFAISPLILATSKIDPGLFLTAISLAAALAVWKTPM